MLSPAVVVVILPGSSVDSLVSSPWSAGLVTSVISGCIDSLVVGPAGGIVVGSAVDIVGRAVGMAVGELLTVSACISTRKYEEQKKNQKTLLAHLETSLTHNTVHQSLRSSSSTSNNYTRNAFQHFQYLRSHCTHCLTCIHNVLFTCPLQYHGYCTLSIDCSFSNPGESSAMIQ